MWAFARQKLKLNTLWDQLAQHILELVDGIVEINISWLDDLASAEAEELSCQVSCSASRGGQLVHVIPRAVGQL